MTRLLLSDAAKAVDGRRNRSRQRSLGPSSVGVCRRKAGYEYHRTPVSNPENDEGSMAAIAGTWMHKGALESMRAEWGAFIETTVEDDPLLGHADALFLPPDLLRELGLDIPAYVEVPTVDDLKTKRDQAAVNQIRRSGPKVAELYQTHLYADMMRRGKIKRTRRKSDQLLAGLGPIDVQWVQLRFVARTGADDEYLYEQAYDPEITAEAWAWTAQITASASPEELPRDEDGPELSYVCDSCPFLDACWGPPIDGRTRQSLTVVEDRERFELLDEYDRVAKEASDLDKRKKALRALVDASDPAIYLHGEEGMRLKWNGGKLGDPKPDVAAMLELLEEAGVEVPMLEARPGPVTISVTRYSREEVLCGQDALPDGTSVQEHEKAHAKSIKAGDTPPDTPLPELTEPVGSCLLKAKHSGAHEARLIDVDA
jgi:nucleotide-binding universal stress UspA family protein